MASNTTDLFQAAEALATSENALWLTTKTKGYAAIPAQAGAISGEDIIVKKIDPYFANTAPGDIPNDVNAMPFWKDKEVQDFFAKHADKREDFAAYAQQYLIIGEKTQTLNEVAEKVTGSPQAPQALSAAIIKSVDGAWEKGGEGFSGLSAADIQAAAKQGIYNLPATALAAVQTSAVKEGPALTQGNKYDTPKLPYNYQLGNDAVETTLRNDGFISNLASNKNPEVRLKGPGKTYVSAADAISKQTGRTINTESENLTVAFTPAQLERAEIKTNQRYHGVAGEFTEITLDGKALFTKDKNVNIALVDEKGKITHELAAADIVSMAGGAKALKLKESEAAAQKASVTLKAGGIEEANALAGTSLPKAKASQAGISH